MDNNSPGRYCFDDTTRSAARWRLLEMDRTLLAPAGHMYKNAEAHDVVWYPLPRGHLTQSSEGLEGGLCNSKMGLGNQKLPSLELQWMTEGDEEDIDPDISSRPRVGQPKRFVSFPLSFACEGQRGVMIRSPANRVAYYDNGSPRPNSKYAYYILRYVAYRSKRESIPRRKSTCWQSWVSSHWALYKVARRGIFNSFLPPTVTVIIVRRTRLTRPAGLSSSNRASAGRNFERPALYSSFSTTCCMHVLLL